ncbi:hypothetical protein [Streptomyces sp. NRRL S-350]|uniref:hypothetical protein n=1 Tax=Streptomyces sp. NRRL S-350 TaxID=1463902 RepID=UPI0004BF7DA7|nr:hypothetical protein [Streptomyces sp. NRRL S-350]
MPDNHARKKAVRAQQAETGGSYRQAALAVSRALAAALTWPNHDDGSGWGHNCRIGDCPDCAHGRLRAEQQRAAYDAELAVYECPGPATCSMGECPEGCNDEVGLSMCRVCWAVDLLWDGPCPHCHAPR